MTASGAIVDGRGEHEASSEVTRLGAELDALAAEVESIDPLAADRLKSLRDEVV